MGVLTSCKPRKEVLKGDLDDAIFAADFGDLIGGTAPPVYRDPKLFFQVLQQNLWVTRGSGKSPSVWYRAISIQR